MSTEMPTAALASVIAGMVVLLYRQFSARTCERRAQSMKLDGFQDQVFRGSKWNYLLSLWGVGMAALMFLFAWQRPHAAWMLIALGTMILLFSGALAWFCLKVIAVFSKGRFLYRVGRRTSLDIELAAIRHVYAADGLLVLDIGEAVRKTVPMVFDDCPKILAMLRHYRPTS